MERDRTQSIELTYCLGRGGGEDGGRERKKGGKLREERERGKRGREGWSKCIRSHAVY